jgi:hypothetical protein
MSRGGALYRALLALWVRSPAPRRLTRLALALRRGAQERSPAPFWNSRAEQNVPFGEMPPGGRSDTPGFKGCAPGEAIVALRGAEDGTRGKFGRVRKPPRPFSGDAVRSWGPTKKPQVGTAAPCARRVVGPSRDVGIGRATGRSAPPSQVGA